MGRAEALPFEDASFDMVTCQTVLIHVPDVSLVLREMMRVLRPGGLLVVAEPNNAASHLIEDSRSFSEPVEEKLARVEFALRCERGKAALGEGHNSVGDLVPGLMVLAGVQDVCVYQSDRPAPYFPPYNTPGQRANCQQIFEWDASGFLGFDKSVARRYFLAGGGEAQAFEKHWEARRTAFSATYEGIRSHTHHAAGGSVFYLISGCKS